MRQMVELLMLMVMVVGCGDDDDNPISSTSAYDQYVRAVRSGHFNSHPYPAVDIGTITDRYFADPSWRSLIATDGNRYVNMVGGMRYEGRTVSARIQFRLYTDGSFVLRAFELDGTLQSDFMIGVLISDMYEEVGS